MSKKITNRIDSEKELAEFIHKLMMVGIEIPSNVTLEIESNILEKVMMNNFFNAYGIDIDNIESVKLTRFTYMGEKITFKSE